MKKITLLLALMLVFITGYGQVSYTYGWEPTGLGNWNGTSGSAGGFTRNTNTPCAGDASARANAYYDLASILRSPNLGPSNGGQITLNYSYKVTQFSDNTIGAPATEVSLVVQYAASTAGPWTTVQTIDSSNHTVATTCAPKTVNFTPGFGDLYIRFVCTAVGEDSDLRYYFDEINISQGAGPTCVPPSALVSSAVTDGSATIGWTAPASAPSEGYQYVYSTSSTAPTGAGTPTSGTSANITGLSANTQYYFWVRSSCGNGDFSPYTASATFTTPCSPVAITYNQGFNATTQPACWTKQNVAVQTSSYISFVTAATDPTAAPQEGSGFVRYNSYSASAGSEERLISAPLSSTGVNNVDVEFYWFQLNGPDYNSGNYLNEGVTVQYSTDGGVNWTNAGGFIPRHVATAPSTGEWSKKTVTLPAAAGNQANFLVALKFHSEYGYNMYADNFTVKATPACANPTALTFVSAGENNINISWTASVSAPANGYQYYVGTTATAPTAATTATGSVGAGVVTANAGSLTPSTGYYIWVRSNCGTDAYSEWVGPVIAGTLCDSGEVLTTTPGTLCGQGNVALAATGNAGAVLNWYAAATGGAILGTGATFNTPLITQTTTYYVSSGNITPNSTAVVGAGGSTSTSGGVSPYYHGWGGVKTQYIIRAAELQAAGIAPGAINSVGFTITSLGTPTLNNFAISMGATTQNVATTTHIDGLTPVYSNAAQTLTGGLNNYAFTSPFTWDGTSNIVVQVCYSNVNYGDTSSGVQYDDPGFVSTTYTYADNQAATAICATLTGGVNGSGNTLAANGRAKMTFNGTTICSGARTPVIATITTAPAITAAVSQATVCAGQSANLSVTSDNADYTYTWMPGNLTGAAQTVSPTETTTYTVTATDNVSGCVTTANVAVAVNPLPSALTVAATGSAVCAEAVLPLTATGGTNGGLFTLGTATTLTGDTEQPTAFCNRWPNYWAQTIYTAAELTAAGLQAGQITSIAYNVATLGSAATNANFTVKIGTTTLSAFADSNYLATTGYTTVYGPVTYTHTATGWQVINFSTPYVWDGVSNIVINVTMDGADSANNTQTYYTATTNNTVLWKYSYSNTTTTGTTSPKRANIRFNNVVANPVTWTPAENLYTNAAATVPYTAGTAAGTVYFKSVTAGAASYTATATATTGCTTTAAVALTVNATAAPTVAAPAVTFCNVATVADLEAEGTAIQWYTAATGGTALTATTGLQSTTYYASQTVNGCESLTRAEVAVTINVTAAPTAETDQVFCNSATLADIEIEGDNILWYATAEGGEALADPTALTTGAYFASQTIDGCTSATRKQVNVTVNVTPAPAAGEEQAFCNAATIADIDVTGTGVQWYTTAEGGEALAADAALESGIYYASQTIDGCESATRTAVGVIINSVEVPAVLDIASCDSYTLPELPEGVTYHAFAQGGGEAIPAGTDITETTELYVFAQVGQCTAEGSFTVTITETPVIAAVSPQSVSTTNDVATVADIVATSEVEITWYATEADAMAQTNPLAITTEVVAGTTYYAAAASGTCVAYASVTVSEVLGNDKFDVRNFAYYPNPVNNELNIKYSADITSVEVYNLLGQLVLGTTPNATAVKVDTNKLAEGTYVVTVKAGAVNHTFKIVKKQ